MRAPQRQEDQHLQLRLYGQTVWGAGCVIKLMEIVESGKLPLPGEQNGGEWKCWNVPLDKEAVRMTNVKMC